MKNKEISVVNFPQVISQFFLVQSVIGQCDACSPVVFVKPDISQTKLFDAHYNANSEIIEQFVNPSHHAILAHTTNTFSVLNQGAMTCLQHFSSPHTFENIPLNWSKTWGKKTVQSTLQQMLQLGLLLPENRHTHIYTPHEVPDILSAWLHITDRCNLQCSYCYLPHKNMNMSFKTGKTSIEATFRSALAHNYKEVKLKYTGGEPLLRFPFVKQLHQYAQKLAEQHKLALDGVVLSNGTLLTKEIIKEMQALGLRLMISLDNLPTPNPSQEGNIYPCPSQQGNLQRIYPDGRDTAGDAVRGIELALECGLIPNISITANGRNVAAPGHTCLPELLAWVLERDLPFSLNFYRDPSTPLRMTDQMNLGLKEGRFIEGMLAAYKVIEENLPRRSLLASLVDLANFAAPHLRRCSVGHSYLVFDPYGRISKCQMQLDKPVTTVQAEDPLAEIRADRDGIQNVSVEEKEGCQDCQWKYWCGGGCPLETYRMTGRYDLKSPHCDIYKALYPEVLRLEGLRLLKYAEEIEHGLS